jgi:hypothetical protein
MRIPSQWANMHLLPSLIDKKRKELKLTPRLAALVKQVTELRDACLQAYHRAKEFTLQWIRPSATGISWHMNARCKPIQAMGLLMVSSSILLSVIRNLSF